jgi:hypothetical protein
MLQAAGARRRVKKKLKKKKMKKMKMLKKRKQPAGAGTPFWGPFGCECIAAAALATRHSATLVMCLGACRFCGLAV